MVECAKCNKEAAEKRCSRCRTTHYCSTECQNADWTSHKQNCVLECVKGIIINCEQDKWQDGICHLFQPVEIRPEHAIYKLGEACPVTKAVGLPLIVYRHVQEPWMERSTDDAGLDNQIATFLMIDRLYGIAPPAYQKQVGTVTVMRKDGKPLTKLAIETIWMYHDHLLDLFGEGDPELPQKQMSRAAFERYCQKYKEEMLINNIRVNEFRTMTLPL